MEKVKPIIVEYELDKRLWIELASTIIYLTNCSPTSTIATTLYQLWRGRKPDLSHLKIIGSMVYVHVLKETQIKLDVHSYKGIIIGYGGRTNQYRI